MKYKEEIVEMLEHIGSERVLKLIYEIVRAMKGMTA